MRGWIELLENSIPIESVPDTDQPGDERPEGTDQLYRLTESGWTVIYRTYLITSLAVIALVIVFSEQTIQSRIIVLENQQAKSRNQEGTRTVNFLTSPLHRETWPGERNHGQRSPSNTK
jgi:hypothetical protein